MSLYEALRDEKPRFFRVNVDANIDPCVTCVIGDEKPHKDCLECPVNPEKKRNNGKERNNQPINSIVISC